MKRVKKRVKTPPTTPFGVRLPNEDFAQLERLAQRRGTPRNVLVKQAIAAYLATQAA